MKTAIRFLAAGALLVAGLPIAAYAQLTSPQTATLNVSATIQSVCVVSSPGNIAFGTIQAPNTANASGSVTITCNKGAVVAATTTSANASGTQKRMQIGTTGEFLNYNVWQPDLTSLGACAAVQTDWTGSQTMTSLWAASGGARVIPVCATTTPGSTNATGTYTDTLTVSVSFS